MAWPPGSYSLASCLDSLQALYRLLEVRSTLFEKLSETADQSIKQLCLQSKQEIDAIHFRIRYEQEFLTTDYWLRGPET